MCTLESKTLGKFILYGASEEQEIKIENVSRREECSAIQVPFFCVHGGKCAIANDKRSHFLVNIKGGPPCQKR